MRPGFFYVCRFRFFLVFSAGCLLSISGALAQAASGPPSSYDPRLTFAPLTLPDPVNAYRSSNGAPGPSYWQNEATYELHAELDTVAKQLRTTEIITYTNNSPDTLPSLWVQLEQNIYRKDSRAQVLFGGLMRRRRNQPEGTTPENTSTEGYVFDSIEIESGKQTTKADYIINDTRMQLRLLPVHRPATIRG